MRSVRKPLTSKTNLTTQKAAASKADKKVETKPATLSGTSNNENEVSVEKYLEGHLAHLIEVCFKFHSV